jgi:hypothetical protein
MLLTLTTYSIVKMYHTICIGLKSQDSSCPCMLERVAGC